MGFWASKPCRIVTGIGLLGLAALVFTGAAFGYTPARWNAATWIAVGVVAACMFVCCCIRGRAEDHGS